jgi:excisionase family DNA binding protein
MAILDDAPQWLTPDEVATRLRLHIQTVRSMLREGRIPARKIGRAWRIDARELTSWAQSAGAPNVASD